MAAMLVRTEYFSGDGESLPVPVEFVTRLMFHHEQSSDLVFYSQQHRLDGYLHLQPKHLSRGEDGQSAPLDLLSGSGSFTLYLPGAAAQRATLRGGVEMDGRQQVQRFEVTASLREPGLHGPPPNGPGLTLFVEGRPTRDDWHYFLKQSGTIVREDAGPMSRLLAAADPHLPGLDLSGVEQMQRQQAAGMRFSAHRGSLRLSGDTIDTYVVTLQHGDLTEATLYFNQLGQILAVKTFAGYDLYDEGITP